MVNLNGKFELADLKAAQDLHARPGRWARWGLFLVLGALGLLLILGIIFGLMGSISWSTIIYPIFLLGFLALFWFVLRPYQITRSYKQHKELSSPFEMELSDEGYSIKNSYGSGKIPWKDFAKWKADKKIILLYRTDNMFNMVPRRLLQDESQAQYVIDQLRQNNVKEASQVRNPVRTVAWAVVAVLLLVVMALLVYINIR
jgi:hypothetical protein